MKENIIYRFFEDEIFKIDREIYYNRAELKRLVEKQTRLKRGKTRLVKLRYELKCQMRMLTEK